MISHRYNLQEQALVKMHNVTFERRQEDRIVPILDHIDLTIESRDFAVVVGPNGSGKTTLMRILVNSIDAEGGSGSGEVAYSSVLSDAERGVPRIGYLRQKPILFPWLTVERNVVFGPRCRGAKRTELRRTFDLLSEMLGIGSFRDKLPTELSGGQAQVAAFAQALATRPRLLVLDEPFSAVDPRWRKELYGALRTIYQEGDLAVVLVTHDLSEALMLARRIIVLGVSGTRGSEVVAEIDIEQEAIGALEAHRLERAIASLFATTRDEPLKPEEALRIERELRFGDVVHVIAFEPEREYEEPESNPFSQVVFENLARGVGYRYFFPDFPARVDRFKADDVLPASIRDFVETLQRQAQLEDGGLEEFLSVYFSPRREVIELSGDCVIIERDGTPLAGWYFPVALNYKHIFRLSGDRLFCTWDLVHSWVGETGNAVRIFPQERVTRDLQQ